MVNDVHEDNQISDQPIFRFIAIPLDGFEPVHTPHGRSEDLAHLFVGRTAIIDKLVDLLRSKSRRGSYLIAGYRGAGKTSVINKALKEYREGEQDSKALKGYREGEQEKARVVLDVRINLGDNSQLTPLNIYYSIANILRDQITSQSIGWENFLKSAVAPRTVGIFAFILLVSIPPIVWFKPAALSFYDNALLVIYLFILLKGIAWSVSQIRHPELRTLKEIDSLIERMSNEISEGRSADLNHRGFSFGLSKNKRRLPINAREAEELLSSILTKIQDLSPSEKMLANILGKPQEIKRKVVIVLDEIDKLSDIEELSEIQYPDHSKVQALGKISRINTLLGSLKNFITTADATFLFISGRETLDRYYSEKGSSNSLYESLFDRVFEVPSFLTDQGERPRGTQLSTLIEEYVCRRIKKKRDAAYNKEDKLEYHTLKNYSKSFQQNILDDVKIRYGINTLRAFIHYLTFHSWGNPKKLSSIFESFIVLKNQVIELNKSGSILIMSDEGITANHWLVFNANHRRSFSLASEITTLFQHQLSREVSKISDKLTVATLSSLHFILKLHSYGFTRESLHRMSEAINVYRSPELNTIIDDLLTQVFKSYIRRVRNGIFRYRFNSGFEQELRYISHVSELESATYNFSLDSMRHVKKFFEDIHTNSKDQEVIARSHITLGDIYAIEQSYTAASVHYSTASRILDELLNQKGIPVNQEILMHFIEAMIKHGDLEERRQNYNHAAAIYFTADRVVEKFSPKDGEQLSHPQKGDSKWDLLKQPFWALRFLSLKRSPSSGNVERPNYLFQADDSRFYYRTATLFFFLGDLTPAFKSYLKVLFSARRKHGKNLSFLDERDAYLSGKAQVGLVECSLVRQSRELFDRDSGTTPSSMGEREFSEKLLKYLSSFSYNPGVKLLSKIKPTSEAFIDDPLKRAATLFEQNYLYISAAITHIKAISYYTAILDVFDYSTFSDDNDIDYKYRQELLTLTENVHKLILTRGADAIRCIEKARQLETSHSNKTLLIYDLTSRHNAHEMNITKLFDMLLRPETDGNYPVNEALFWQNSLWAHKLVATLCWAHYVKRKIEIKPEVYESHKNIPGYLPGILGVSGFSVRPAILLRWICARDLNRQHIDKKLVTINEKGCDVNKILKNLSNVQLTIAGKKIVDYLKLQKREDSKIPPILKNAYLISRYLYFAQESSRIISRKNLDLIFPRLPQLYFAQWKLLLNLISTMLVGRDEIIKHTGEQLDSVRDFSFLLQRALVAIDQDLAPEERIAPSHFDYEFIYLRLNESLESSKSLVDTTSRAHKSIFQHKYFCHDDHSDPDFRMDYTLAYMFTPRAQYVHEEIKKTHQELKQVLEEHPMP